MMLLPETATPWTSPSVTASHRRAPLAAVYSSIWPPLPPPPTISRLPVVRSVLTAQTGWAANLLSPPVTQRAARCRRRRPFTRLNVPPANTRFPRDDIVSARTVELALGCQGASRAVLVCPTAGRRLRLWPFTRVKLPPI